MPLRLDPEASSLPVTNLQNPAPNLERPTPNLPLHSQRNTFAEIAMQTTNTATSAATSPTCADHGSLFRIPVSSDTTYVNGSSRATVRRPGESAAIGKNRPDK